MKCCICGDKVLEGGGVLIVTETPVGSAFAITSRLPYCKEHREAALKELALEGKK